MNIYKSMKQKEQLYYGKVSIVSVTLNKITFGEDTPEIKLK